MFTRVIRQYFQLRKVFEGYETLPDFQLAWGWVEGVNLSFKVNIKTENQKKKTYFIVFIPLLVLQVKKKAKAIALTFEQFLPLFISALYGRSNIGSCL